MIDEVTYKLPNDNYIQNLSAKKQIVIGHTFNNNMKHFYAWRHRFNGKNKKTAAFTIATDGTIYQHFEPIYNSEFFGDKIMDTKTIVILIENDGWLLKNTEKDLYITCLGDIYSNKSEVVEKRWRGYDYWCPYNEKQIEAAVKIVRKLCSEFLIPQVSINHNTKLDNISNYEGVLYRSNLDKHYTDLNPSWSFEKFKNNLELK